MNGQAESPGSYSVCEVKDRFWPRTGGNIVSFGTPKFGRLVRSVGISPGAEFEHCVPQEKARILEMDRDIGQDAGTKHFFGFRGSW
jgi:hypothetical protein